MTKFILFISLARVASADPSLTGLEGLVSRIRGMTCATKLAPVPIARMSPEARQFEHQLLIYLRDDAEPMGPALMKGLQRLSQTHPIGVDVVQSSDRHSAHLAVIDVLRRQIGVMSPTLTRREQGRALARTVAMIYAELERDAGKPAVPLGRAMADLAERLGEPFPLEVSQRMLETSVFEFMFDERRLIGEHLIDSGPERPVHQRVSRKLKVDDLPREVMAQRLRNDFRLLRIKQGRGYVYNGHDLRRLRNAVDVLGVELNETFPKGTLHDFDATTLESIVTNATTSLRLRNLLLDLIPPMDVLTMPEEASDSVGGTLTKMFARRAEEAQGLRAPPVDPRASRVAGLKWFVAFVRPELFHSHQAAVEALAEARAESQPYVVIMNKADVADVRREARAGLHDEDGYLEWVAVSEACFVLPHQATPAYVRPRKRDMVMTRLSSTLSMW